MTHYKKTFKMFTVSSEKKTTRLNRISYFVYFDILKQCNMEPTKLSGKFFDLYFSIQRLLKTYLHRNMPQN